MAAIKGAQRANVASPGGVDDENSAGDLRTLRSLNHQHTSEGPAVGRLTT